jgi:DNA repair protein RadC
MKTNESPTYLSIKEWAEEDRPREKLLLKGKASLSDAELIAILLGSGTVSMSAVELAKQILHSVNHNLHELAQLTIKDLEKFKGIGEAKAITIVAALELGRRRKNADVQQRSQVESSKDVYEILQADLLDLPYEEFWALYLNRANQVIRKVQISRGGVVGTVADVRLILKHGIELLASGIVLAHNHPSGNLQPSPEDLKLTQKVKEAAQLMNMTLLDHLIIGHQSYFSFVDEDVMKQL